ncbi:glycosyltransferase [Specibacter sp. NPDC057265]|uniref:glycosyltransferase n=1 Tax=Specibacter sp. NPDC057265 TaxID=3346075 RepID=UPI003626A065
MNHQARVSVVIPVKNDSAELARCLAALARQSRPADELIVVDNGSSDDSAQTAVCAGATVISCLAPGIPAASSCGYDAATGDLILRLDADCVPAPSWIAEVVSSFETRPDVSAFSGYARFIDGPKLLRAPLAALYLLAYVLATAPALGHWPLFGSNMAMRREAWDAVRAAAHRDDPELHDDMDLSFHLGEGHRIRYLKGAAMGMSMRPFHSAAAFRRRLARGFRTVLAHWPHDFPPRRWGRRISRAAGLGR